MIRMADYFNFALYPATLQPSGTINMGRIFETCRAYDLLTYTVLSRHKYLGRIVYTFIESNAQSCKDKRSQENNNRIFGEEYKYVLST